MEDTESLTIIMRTKNSAWVLEQTLKALFSQSFTNFELHIVDSSSKDQTESIAKKFPCQFSIIEASDYFPGKVLNTAIRNSKTSLIVFLNSDAVLLSPHSLQKLVEAFNDPKVVAAFGRQISRPEALPWVKRQYNLCFPEEKEPPSWISLSLPFAAMRRSVWKERPFYTWAWGSEDSEWGHWARQQQGYRVAYVPKALVMHSHNYSLRELYERKFIEGEADAYIFKKKKLTFLYFISRSLIESLRTLRFYLRLKAFSGLFTVPVRCFVDQWAYYKGWRLGRKRLFAEIPTVTEESIE